MLAHGKRIWRSIRSGIAGSRFRDHHRREVERHQSRHSGAYIALGIFLMVAGVLLSIPPAVPGFIVTLIGAAIVSSRSARAARAFDRTELRMRRILSKVMPKRVRQPGKE